MDLSHKDFNVLLGTVQGALDMIEWQIPSDIPTINQAYQALRTCKKVLLSYVDVDPESTTLEQLELAFPELLNDEDDN